MAVTFKLWNQAQKNLRRLLEDPSRNAEALAACLEQHGWTHERQVWAAPLATFADQLWQHLDSEVARRIPQSGEHSIAWIYWHLARIEDTAFNLLVAGSPMVLDQGQWNARLNVSARDTGNGMAPEEIEEISASIDLYALRAYRIAVGQRTQEIIQSLTVERLSEKVRPEDIQNVRRQAAVRPAAESLLDYWGRRTIRGLLLMPATRHNMVHLNEAFSLKVRVT